MQPKTTERLISLRKHNRRMPRRRMDIPVSKILYTNPELLQRFLTETGKLQPRRVTGLTARLHRLVTREVKRARSVNLLPA
jgi:small subunit ribosomal protein S18